MVLSLPLSPSLSLSLSRYIYICVWLLRNCEEKKKKMEMLNLGFDIVRELTKLENTRRFTLLSLVVVPLLLVYSSFVTVSFSYFFFLRNYKNRKEELFSSFFFKVVFFLFLSFYQHPNRETISFAVFAAWIKFSFYERFPAAVWKCLSRFWLIILITVCNWKSCIYCI